jgi:hypothetical protein
VRRRHRVAPRALVLVAALAPAARSFGSQLRSASADSPLPPLRLSLALRSIDVRSPRELCVQATLVCALSLPRPCLRCPISPRRDGTQSHSCSSRALELTAAFHFSVSRPARTLSGTVVRSLRPRAQATRMPSPPLSLWRERFCGRVASPWPRRCGSSRGWPWVPSATRRRWAGDAAPSVARSSLARASGWLARRTQAPACPLHLHRRA